MEENKNEKKKFYKKWWFWTIIVVVLIIIVSSSSSNTTNTSTQTSTNTSQKNNLVEVTVPDLSSMSRDEINTWFSSNKMKGKISDEYSLDVPKGNFISQSITANTVAHEGDKITVIFSLGKEPTKEEKNALEKANSYSKNMHMSKKRLYEQLTSSYGEAFTAEAAQYAIDNITVDWNENALKKAKSYQSSMNMSKQRIYEQLTSSYGEGFTEEEAQYAIEHLDE